MGERILEVEVLAALVERGDLEIGAELDRALVRLDLPGQHFQERCLAGAVRADKTDAVAAVHANRKRGDDGAVAIGLGDLFGLDDQLAGITRVGNGCLHRTLRAAMAAMFGAQVLERAQPAHVALAPGSDAVAQPVFLALDFLAELVLLDLFLFQHLVAPGFEVAETLVETARLAAIQPHGGVGNLFEEATVVGDDHERRAALDQLAFQPFDGRQVEMVGRFVEQQDIRLRCHDAGECCSAGFAAGQLRRILFTGQAQMFEQIGDAVGIVAGPKAGFRIGKHGVIALEIRRLMQIADCRRRMAEDFAGLRLGEAGGHLHQGRFARAVAANQTDAVAGLHLQVCPAKSGVPPKDRKMSSSFRMGGAKFRLPKGHRAGQE